MYPPLFKTGWPQFTQGDKLLKPSIPSSNYLPFDNILKGTFRRVQAYTITSHRKKSFFIENTQVFSSSKRKKNSNSETTTHFIVSTNFHKGTKYVDCQPTKPFPSDYLIPLVLHRHRFTRRNEVYLNIIRHPSN